MLKARHIEAGASVRHGFLDRRDGVSEGLYESLNCGAGSDDAAANVQENRRRALVRAGLGEAALVTVYQVHSARVVRVMRPWDTTPPRADAMLTGTPGVALGILTADCVPVLFAAPAAGVVAAAHAGWQGTLGGIIENTIAALESAGAARADIRAAIGPAIQQRSYQVGAELRAAFVERLPGADVFFTPDGVAGKYLFDLPGVVRARLEAHGLGRVEQIENDTYEEETAFFSYRRSTHQGAADYGRQISLIGIVG